MKCPKCGYLGFETSERCRNCGYDFSLASEVGPPVDELPLRSTEGAGAPLADFDLSDRIAALDSDDAAELDLDRVIGAGAPASPAAPTLPAAPRPPDAPVSPAAPLPPAPPVPELPLFGGDEDAPMLTAPRPALPPLSVRRTTPEIPRVRARRTQPALTPSERDRAFQLEGPHSKPESPLHPTRRPDPTSTPASPFARLAAAVIDVALLAVINAAVVYLTLALAGLTWQQYEVLPLAPLVGFLTILDGGYLIVFVAAGGQTIGKMVAGVRVVGDDGQRVDVAGAVLRAAGCAASTLTLGLGYLPAFVTADRRALQDRIAGTRVVRAR